MSRNNRHGNCKFGPLFLRFYLLESRPRLQLNHHLKQITKLRRNFERDLHGINSMLASNRCLLGPRIAAAASVQNDHHVACHSVNTTRPAILTASDLRPDVRRQGQLQRRSRRGARMRRLQDPQRLLLQGGLTTQGDHVPQQLHHLAMRIQQPGCHFGPEIV